MDFYEKTIDSKEIFDGVIINVKVDTVSLPGGGVATREIVSHPGGVCIVAIDESENVYMVRQFRKPYDKELLEIPAGKLDYGEDPLICGIRELSEETGLEAKSFISLGEMYPSPGFANEVIHIYLAVNLIMGSSHTDEDEFLEVIKIPFDDVLSMIMSNEIKDAKTIIGILKAKQYLGK